MLIFLELETFLVISPPAAPAEILDDSQAFLAPGAGPMIESRPMSSLNGAPPRTELHLELVSDTM